MAVSFGTPPPADPAEALQRTVTRGARRRVGAHRTAGRRGPENDDVRGPADCERAREVRGAVTPAHRMRRPRWQGRSPRLAPAVLAASLAATLLASALFCAGPGPVSASSAAPTPSVQTPTVPGAGTAYLGAFVDPRGTSLSAADPTGGTASVPAELSALPAFDAQEGRAPSVLSTFQQWSEPVGTTGLDTVAATGAIPLVTWSCGDTDARVAAGLDDRACAGRSPRIGGHSRACSPALVPRSQSADRSGHGVMPRRHRRAGYIASFQHIRSLFAGAGATNVAFVWSVDTSGTADPNLANYYPGASAVDWIAADGAQSGVGSQPDPFTSMFGSWYSAFSTAGKPLMVSATGSPAGSQSAYLGQILSDLPNLYPQIKSLIYVDAPDPSTGTQYQLDAAGADAFKQLAAAQRSRPTGQCPPRHSLSRSRRCRPDPA